MCGIQRSLILEFLSGDYEIPIHPHPHGTWIIAISIIIVATSNTNYDKGMI